MLVTIKQINPIIIESRILPTKKPPKVLLANLTLLIKRLARSNERNAYAIFFA